MSLDSFQRAVTEFHQKFGAEVGDEAAPAIGNWALRYALIAEELDEYVQAAKRGDVVGAIDALGDLAYVVMGGFVQMGVKAGPVVEEIHDSNMSKLGPNGQPVYRGDGKILKGPQYRKPDLKRVLDEQIRRAHPGLVFLATNGV